MEEDKIIYTCCQCGEETDKAYYCYYAGDTEDNHLCENGDCWADWMQDNTYEVDYED